MNHSKWYILYTTIGNEAECVSLVKEQIPQNTKLYEDIFVLEYENVWKKQGKSLIDIENMFAGYLFVRTDKAAQLEAKLQEIPGIHKQLETLGGNETSENLLQEMQPSEVDFFLSLLDKNEQGDYVVHRSFVKREDGKIAKAAGPLATT